MAKRIEHARARKAKALIEKTGHAAGKLISEAEDRADDKAVIRKAISEHDHQLHPGHHTRLALKDGGMASGGMTKPRGDRKGRGSGTKINIVVAPQAHSEPGMPMGPGGMPPHPPMMPPPHPPMGPGGPPPGAMGGMPPGGPPMMPPGGMPPRPMGLKGGGRVDGINGGAGGGVGRIEKAEANGAHKNKRSGPGTARPAEEKPGMAKAS